MSIRPDAPAILSDGQEVKVHGSEAFPFAVYRGIMPHVYPCLSPALPRGDGADLLRGRLRHHHH